MNKSMMMIMGGALLIAIVVAMLVQMKLAPKKTAAEASPGTEVLMATKDLLAGEELKAENPHWESFPEKLVFKGMIKKSDQADEKKLEVYGKPLRRDITSG